MPDLYTAKPKTKKIIEEMPSTTNPFRSFSLRPANFGFENQNKDETVILLLRRHWVTNFGWIFLGIILFFAPVIFIDFPAITILPIKYKLMCLVGCYLLWLAFIFEKFLTWFFNAAIITDQRVVDVDFYGLLYKEITDAELGKIQDVTQKQVGAIRAIFNFGWVYIQTAGEQAMIEFEDIPHPEKVVKILQDLR